MNAYEDPRLARDETSKSSPDHGETLLSGETTPTSQSHRIQNSTSSLLNGIDNKDNKGDYDKNAAQTFDVSSPSPGSNLNVLTKTMLPHSNPIKFLGAGNPELTIVPGATLYVITESDFLNVAYRLHHAVPCSDEHPCAHCAVRIAARAENVMTEASDVKEEEEVVRLLLCCDDEAPDGSCQGDLSLVADKV